MPEDKKATAKPRVGRKRSDAVSSAQAPKKTAGRKPSAKSAAKPVRRPAAKTASARAKVKKISIPKKEVTHKVAVSPESTKGRKAPVIDYWTLAVLVGCLMLSAANLSAIISATGRAKAMEESRNLMMDNYSRVVERQAALMSEIDDLRAQPVAAPSEDKVPVLWSVAKFQSEREKLAIEVNMLQPLIAWQKIAKPEVEAILIERRYETSENVAVRVFLKDGRQVPFLWPDEGPAEQGVWVPPCGANTPAELEPTDCPAEYLMAFPRIDAILAAMEDES